MKYLLDTSVFLWALAAPGKLNRRARSLLSNEREGLFLSAASSWEISLKFGLGKLELPEPPVKYVPKWMLNWGIRALDISHLHALAVGDLPAHHQDPFDRILIVQATTEDMVLLTADRMFEKYPVEMIWSGA
ncbi:MAG: type II toxin-antitoxin system VapC family toxin [Candidatus Acidiferrales bacterium]